MTQPLPLDTVLSEFSANSEAWVLQAKRSGKYLTIPDNRFPGRRPVRFFMSRLDADRMLTEVLKVNPSLVAENIKPVSVKLLQAIRSIAADKTPGNADSFVVHTPNEMYDFLHDRPS
jgi:hypothetical protein